MVQAILVHRPELDAAAFAVVQAPLAVTFRATGAIHTMASDGLSR